MRISMRGFLERILWIGMLLSPLDTQGSSLKLDALSESQFKSIAKEFSTHFTSTVVSPASPLGSVFGFEVGAIVGVTESQELKSLVAQSGGGDLSFIPHVALQGQVSLPGALTLQAQFLPKVDVQNFTPTYLSGGLKWTFSDFFTVLPFSLAFQFNLSSAELAYDQDVNQVRSHVTFKDSIQSSLFLLSKDLILIEPYLGYGWVRSQTEMSYTGTSSIFNFTGASSSKADFSGNQIVLGLNLKLVLLTLGGEYSQVLDNTKYSLKVSFGF